MPHPKGKSIRKGPVRTLSGNGGIGIIICGAVFYSSFIRYSIQGQSGEIQVLN